MKLLTRNNIRARVGGSVAALGYATTRVPDDVDIDIFPKLDWESTKTYNLEHDFATSKKLVLGLINCQFSPQGFVSGTYLIQNIKITRDDLNVCGLVIYGKYTEIKYNQTSFQIETNEAQFQVNVQLVNEMIFAQGGTALPGNVIKEKFKEVTGFSRLAANSIDRLIASDGKNKKNDELRLVQMFKTKCIGLNQKKIYDLCVKIIHYFKDTWKEKAAQKLAEIVSVARDDINQTEFARMLNAYIEQYEIEGYNYMFK